MDSNTTFPPFTQPLVNKKMRSLAASVVVVVVVVAALALPSTASLSDKQCVFHYDANFKSMMVWNTGFPDLNLCNYWNLHYTSNYNSKFFQAQGSLKHVCVKPNIREIGFYMESALNEAPDRLFTDAVCKEYYPQHIFPFVVGTGWTCVSVPDLKRNCEAQGNPIKIPRIAATPLP
ncbi:hypothetical protein HDU96_002697 [Phlyctochytrium bullatum]|nr:hypothetical protein HDU96_002697 [Phlyctochytrium bullatum]